MVEKVGFSSVVSNRGFLNLWLNQFLVQLSFNSLNFTLIIWVFQLTNSNTAVAVLLLVINLPAVLLGLFSGVLVDVIDRKKIILFIDFFLGLLFFNLIFFKDSYPAILLTAFFVNALVQFYAPAEASAIPLIVKKNQLIPANSIFSATLYSCFLLGFGLAGPLINSFDINIIFIFGGGALILAFVLALAFPSITSKVDAEGKKFILALKKRNYADIKEVGIAEITKTLRLIKGKLPVLTSIFILAGLQMVVGVLAVLTPAFLEKSLHIKATGASFILVLPLGLGILLGGFILVKIGHKLIKRLLVARAIIFGGLLFFLVGVTQPSLAIVIAIGAFLLGICLVSVIVPTQTVLHENTPEQNRGKVFSVLGVAMCGLSLVPVFLAGVFSDLFGVTPIFIVLGIVIMIIGLFGLKPAFFFKKDNLPFRVREFLGLGHWN